MRLLNRTTRKSHLTEAGARYYPRAQQLLSDLDDMDHQLVDLQTQARGGCGSVPRSPSPFAIWPRC